MRFSVSFGLVVATLVACFSIFVRAEYVNNRGEERHLRAEVPPTLSRVEAAEQFITEMQTKRIITKAQDLLKKHEGNKDMTKYISEGVVRGTNVAKMSDESIAKLTKMMAETAKEGAKVSDDATTKLSKSMTMAAKEGAEVSDETVAKLSESMAVVAKQNPKSWPRLKMVAKVTLGAGVSALAIYGAYKLLTKENASAVVPTTTTGTA